MLESFSLPAHSYIIYQLPTDAYQPIKPTIPKNKKEKKIRTHTTQQTQVRHEKKIEGMKKQTKPRPRGNYMISE